MRATPRPAPASLRAAQRLLAPVTTRLFGVVIENGGYVPGSGGVLVAANHRSFLDHFVLAAACNRPIRFLGKRELATGFGGQLNVRFGGMVPVDRGRADTEAMADVVALLRLGEVIGIFPEGSRSLTGELHRFRSGLSRIAAAARVPTVPVALLGTAEVWPLGGKPTLQLRHRGAVRVRFAPPVPPPEPDGAARRAFTLAVREAIAARSDQELGARFAPVGT